ncbi:MULTISPECIES: dihydrolipoyl dehydrogenase family protein [Leptolyngbya]|uniref:dihydrolipoyl dehydrogenase family protein n=1 Tax=Leptolyngbya TaxID=47251 RepID=UPI001685BE32|nr:NAD(P)/FAD-dependent oxidoreductase [Leptolyngbya sp. FACHB-1624]MBD1860038.1 NAD(P)/FAD-dependent oxidoreductase [Leptolyngbya sp. FACHB-1624]
MAYDYDVLVIGMGPAGMAISAMAAEMDLKVCGIESHRLGGECMNVGCIPSKALLRMAKTRNAVSLLDRMELETVSLPQVRNPFQRIQSDIHYINNSKTKRMFEKVDLVLQQGTASFVDPHTVAVGDFQEDGTAECTIIAKRIFIATGTQPAIPPFPGIDSVEVLTNNNLFSLDRIPESLVILGGGAIACEMAQAFSRLGSRCTMIIRGPNLLRGVDADAVKLLEDTFQQAGIEILRRQTIQQIMPTPEGGVKVLTEEGEVVEAEKLLVATGRKMDFSGLNLEKAGVKYDSTGIQVNPYLQTSQKHIFAVGDCNGYAQFSHAAMHQGMIALINTLMPHPLKQDFRQFVVPWTVFTEPQISHVGPSEEDLQAQKTAYETVQVRYEDYGAAIAEGVDIGFVKVLTNATGKLFAATVVGEGSGEMVNEWGLAIQRKLRMVDILFLQHSFPSMAFLNKRIAETWMMKRMKLSWLRAITRTLYRL